MIGRIKDQFRKVFAPVARVIARSRISPNFLTVLGLFVAIIAAFMYVLHQLLFAILLFLLSGFIDALDGAVARVQGKITPFGGVFDSISDRYSDAIVLFGVILGGWASPFWGILALIGSLLVSYARARAEAAGVKQLGVGLAERPERIIILIIVSFLQYLTLIGVLVPPPVFFGITLWTEYGIILIAILAHITVLQRTIKAYRALSKHPEDSKHLPE